MVYKWSMKISGLWTDWSDSLSYTTLESNDCAAYFWADCTMQPCPPPEPTRQPARLERVGHCWAATCSAVFLSFSHCCPCNRCICSSMQPSVGDVLIVQSCLLSLLSFHLLRQTASVSLLPQLLINCRSLINSLFRVCPKNIVRKL